MSAPLDRAAVLAVARALASLFGARLFCACGRDWISDDGICPRCAQDDPDDRRRE